MYIEDHEYMAGFRGGRGLRMDIHDFNSYPSVKEAGVSAAPGFHTYIGLTLV